MAIKILEKINAEQTAKLADKKFPDNGTKNASGNFTVSRDSYGVRVEKLFPFNSPAVEKIVVVKKNASWRSKLYTERTFCSHKAVRKLVKK